MKLKCLVYGCFMADVLLVSGLAAYLVYNYSVPDTLLGPFARKHGFDIVSEQELLFDQKTGNLIESVEDTQSYVLAYRRADKNSEPEIRVYNEKDVLETGEFPFGNGVYYSEPETGILQTGEFEVPFREVPDKYIHYLIEQSLNENYGAIAHGLVSDETNGGRFFMNNGNMFRSEFAATHAGVAYADSDGYFRVGEFIQDGHTYKTDEQGYITHMDKQPFRILCEDENQVSLWLKGSLIYADSKSMQAEILRESADVAARGVYISKGRESPHALDCIGYVLSVLNPVYQSNLSAESCNKFGNNKNNGYMIDVSELMPGDVIMYKGTFLNR